MQKDWTHSVKQEQLFAIPSWKFHDDIPNLLACIKAPLWPRATGHMVEREIKKPFRALFGSRKEVAFPVLCADLVMWCHLPHFYLQLETRNSAGMGHSNCPWPGLKVYHQPSCDNAREYFQIRSWFTAPHRWAVHTLCTKSHWQNTFLGGTLDFAGKGAKSRVCVCHSWPQ